MVYVLPSGRTRPGTSGIIFMLLAPLGVIIIMLVHMGHVLVPRPSLNGVM